MAENVYDGLKEMGWEVEEEQLSSAKREENQTNNDTPMPSDQVLLHSFSHRLTMLIIAAVMVYALCQNVTITPK